MTFSTTLQAIDPNTGELGTYSGPRIEADSWEDAERFCKKHLPYCTVDAKFNGEFGWRTAEVLLLLWPGKEQLN